MGRRTQEVVGENRTVPFTDVELKNVSTLIERLEQLEAGTGITVAKPGFRVDLYDEDHSYMGALIKGGDDYEGYWLFAPVGGIS